MKQDRKMIQYKRKIKRYVIAAILLVFATYGTIFIKNTVDSINPERSLPLINVSAGYTQPYVVRAGYTWSFGHKTVRSPYVSASDTPLTAVETCAPGENIVINFSAPYEYINVEVTKGLANDDFEKVYNLVTPEEEGIYVYKIDAKFEKGDILYYFATEIKNTNLTT